MNDPQPPPYTDQRWRLIVLGILELGIAGLAGLAAVGMSATMFFSSQYGDVTPMSSILGVVVFYCLAVVVFTILGVGSFLTRRWARALNLVLGWTGLTTGVFAQIFMVAMLPGMIANMTPVSDDPVTAALPMIVAIGCVGIIYLGIPLAIILLASGRSVRLTVEYRDPTPDWTDNAPLPVLGFALYLSFGVISALFALLNPVMPLYGAIMTGVPVIFLSLLMSAILIATAVGLYRLRPLAWWSAVAIGVMGVVVSLPTLMMMDLRSVYVEMGLWTSELEQMGMGDMFDSPIILVGFGIFWAAWFGYLAWIRRYFRSELRGAGSAEPHGASSPSGPRGA